MNFGTGEIIMITIILVVVFSASQMGTLGNALGRFVHSFKKASQGDGYVDVKPTAKLEARHERGSEDAEVIDGSPKR